MKIGSIILAVVVSLVVWAASFKFLFPYDSPIFSAVVALAGGIIAVLLLLILKKPAIVQVLFAALGATVFLFVAAKFSSHPECNGPRTVTVLCDGAQQRIILTDDEPISDDDRICIKRARKIRWIVDRRNPDGTDVKIHDFKKGGLPAQPLDSNKYEGHKLKDMPASVMYTDGGKTVEGEYKYTVTCTQGGTSYDLDPIIKVPH